MKRVWNWISAILIVLLLGAIYTPSSVVLGTIVRDYVFVTKWGSQGSGAGQFSVPFGIAVDLNGNVYVADSNNSRIQKFNTNGTYIMQWGIFGTGDGQFKLPCGIAVDGSGYVYVADTGNNRIQKFTSNGTYITQWGGFGAGDGKLGQPTGVAVDGSGNVYVADTGNKCVQKFTSGGGYVAKWLGIQGTSMLIAVAVDGSGNVYASDLSNQYVLKYKPNGTFISLWGLAGSSDGQFNYPYGLAMDGTIGIFVADAGNCRIQLFSLFYSFGLKWGSKGMGDSQFMYPRGVAVDGSGNVYVSDTGNNRIQKFAPSYYGTLRIFLRDIGGLPLRGVTVTTTAQPNGQPAFNGTTGADGMVIFRTIFPGNYTVRFSLAGYLTSSLNIGVVDGSTTEPSVTMRTQVQSTGSLKVTVKNSTGVVIPGASVLSTIQPSGQTMLNGTTGMDGVITFSNITLGNYTMQASKSRFISGSAQVNVGGGLAEITITLQSQSSSRGNLKIIVKGAGGAAISGAAVISTTQPTGQIALSDTTGADGTISFSNVSLGNYTIQASKTGYTVASSGQLNVEQGRTVEFTITLIEVTQQQGTIKVIILRSNGNPLIRATVSVGSQTQTTGSDGTVTLTSVSPGTYTATASRTGYATKASNPFTVDSGATSQVTITLDEQGEATLDHFEFNTIHGSMTVGVAFTITIMAKDQRGDTLASYSGVNTLSTLQTPDPLNPTPLVTPNVTAAFTHGEWSSAVSLSIAGQSVTMKTTGGGKSGLSNTFEVMRSGYEDRGPGVPSYPFESTVIGVVIGLYFIAYKLKRIKPGVSLVVVSTNT